MEFSLGLALWVTSLAALAVATGLGMILLYHWIRYAMSPIATALMILAYSSVSATLLMIMFGIASTYKL